MAIHVLGLAIFGVLGFCGSTATAQHRGPGKIGNAKIKTSCSLHNAPQEVTNAKTGKVEQTDDWNATCELRDAQTNKILAKGRIVVSHPAGLTDVSEQIEACIAAETLKDKRAFLLEDSGNGH